MALIRLFDDLSRTPANFSNFVDQFFNEAARQSGAAQFRPTVDIAETETAYEVHVNAPGMEKKDFDVQIDKDVLSISGKREFKREDKDDSRNYHLVESSYGSFERRFTLPEHVKQEDIKASYEDGVLKLEIPKDEKKAGKRNIEIS